ncbi:MAG: hypothetical protein GY771_14480 [bacterium]|nr:hypothetical protein [bacterium]
MRIYDGGTCDSGGYLGVFPEYADQFYLGELGDDGFKPIIDNYFEDKPEILKFLSGVTWGELAQEFGDGANDELFYDFDLVKNRWARMFVGKYYGGYQGRRVPDFLKRDA